TRIGTRTKTGQRLFDGQQAARLHQANQADLQVKPRLQRVLQILEEIERELQVARQVLFGEPFGDGGQLVALRRAGRHQARIGARHPGDQQIAEVARQLAAEMLQVLSVALQLVDHFQHAPRIAGGERERDLLEQIQAMRPMRSSKSTLRKLKCWQRDAMVAGILCASVVQSTKTAHGGGSSMVFKSALKASLVIWWASSMMKIL